MASVDNVDVNVATGVDGNAYTSSVSNDTLTNEDFLNLMIQELKMQDPTSPMDSQRMLDTQMQMSSIETNIKTIEAMDSLQNSIANMSLTNAMGFMGKKVDAVVDMPAIGEDGNVLRDDDNNIITEKVKASFYINTVRIDDGEVYLESSELLDIKDRAYDAETGDAIRYDFETGQIKNSDDSLSEYYIKLDENGRFDMSTGKIIITDAEGNVENPTYSPEDSDLEFPKFAYVTSDEIYSENNTNLRYVDIVKVYQ